MFGTQSRPGSLFGGTTGALGGGTTLVASTSTNTNPMKSFEVNNVPDDTIQAMSFSPGTLSTTFLACGSWDNLVRVWQVNQDGSCVPKAEQQLQGPVLAIDWSDDGSKLFISSADKLVRGWDLGSNTLVPMGQHEAPVSTCHWVTTPQFQLLMTGGWDKFIKFWDPRQGQAQPAAAIQMPERVYCADVVYPMAAVALAGRKIKIYSLTGSPTEVKDLESPLKYQSRCISIFKDKTAAAAPTGFALGSIEGRVAIQYVDSNNPKDNFTFKCHRSAELVNGYQDIYAVNDVKFHPTHGTLATVGSDARFSFWDKDARTKLKTSEPMAQPITKCAFNATGQIFAYSVGYDWSKGHEFYNPQAKSQILLHPCFDDMKPKPKK